jgi:hypothetical protein
MTKRRKSPKKVPPIPKGVTRAIVWFATHHIVKFLIIVVVVIWTVVASIGFFLTVSINKDKQTGKKEMRMDKIDLDKLKGIIKRK